MMKDLTNEQKQFVLDGIRVGSDCYGGDNFYFAMMISDELSVSYKSNLDDIGENAKRNWHPISDLRKELEAEPQPITPKLTYLIDIFKAEFPKGFQSIEGYSKEDFDDEVLSMSSHAGLIKFTHYTATNKAPPEPEDKQQKIVDAVNLLKCDLGNLRNGAYGLYKSIILKVNGDYYGTTTGKSAFYREHNERDQSEVFSYACTIKEFNQCISDLTGDPLKHAAWLAALDDIRNDELQRIGNLGRWSTDELLIELRARIL